VTAERAVDWARKHYHDVVIIDSAGRLAIDEAMMREIAGVHAAAKPIETLFVVDAMQGHGNVWIVTQAVAFDDGVRLGTGTRAILSEGTFTPSYKFTDHVLLRGEARYDKANQPILTKRGTLADKQTTIAANVIFVD